MSKQEMKKKKIKLPIGLILIILIAIIIVGVIVKNNNKAEKSENKVQNTAVEIQDKDEEVKEETKEEYVQILQDGSKLNISEALNKEKKIGNLILKDIQLTCKDGVTTLLTNVENTSKEKSKQKEVEIVLVNEKQEKLYTLRGVIEEIEPGTSKQLNTSITADFANAYDFTIKEK